MSKYSERIYSESEIKLIEEIFDMTIKQIYDDDLEELVLQCKEMFLEHQNSLKEIERLNNIINELAFIFDDYNEFNKILEKYNYELKGVDK